MERSIGLDSKDALVALLTVETLLFAAFAVAAIFIQRTDAGWDLLCGVDRFAVAVCLTILLVGAGAAWVWSDLYLRCGLSTVEIVGGVALAIGIVAVAGMSIWVAWALARNAPT